MNFDKYYEAREKICEIMQKDLLGPVNDNEVICGENPLDYYITGKLYPQCCGIANQIKSSSEDCGDLDNEDSISLNGGNYPSSFGITFSLHKSCNTFNVKIYAAKYILTDKSQITGCFVLNAQATDKVKKFWKRSEQSFGDICVNVLNLIEKRSQNVILTEGIRLNVILHKTYPDGSKTVTVTLINDCKSENNHESDCLKSIFQPKITISSNQQDVFMDIRRNTVTKQNIEVAELSMLYHKIGNFASGHGCAADWVLGKDNLPISLSTDFLPIYELKQMVPSEKFDGNVLQMNYLSTASQNEIILGLNLLTDNYSSWIFALTKQLEKLSGELNESAKLNINKCKDTCERLKLSISCLHDPLVFKAFALANKAMFMQRKQTLKNIKKYESDEKIRWYPFQLAFFLQEIVSFAKPGCEERKKVDLLWFPTGGGKTEAYLGIAAFAIFLRRLKNSCGGVTVLMRYTLRLLTFQQFERASAMICACELIRKHENIPGGQIGIGLWVGMSLTPNTVKDAQDVLLEAPKKFKLYDKGNPVQITRCPWCGSELTKSNYKCDIGTQRMTVSCSNPDCEFHDGLPVYLTDEEIYKYKPTFIVATVDKFAQLTFNPDCYSLFGINENILPPELIIQDELHLISGP